jgi:hypothetical protein
MNKNILTSVIDKYYLNGIVESVKWNIKDKVITVDFITPFKNLVGKVTSPNFDLEDSEVGIYNTSQFYKLIKIMDNTTANYEVMVIDNTTQENSITDQIKWYKATEKNFKMCSPELWNLCALEEQRQQDKLFYENDEDEEEDFDPNMFIKNNNKIKLNVKKKI